MVSSSSNSRPDGQSSHSQRARTIKQLANRNYGAAFFQMLTIALLCTSIAQPSWLTLISRSSTQPGEKCPKHLTLYQFVDYGYFETADIFNTTTSTPIRMLYHSSHGGTLFLICKHICATINSHSFNSNNGMPYSIHC